MPQTLPVTVKESGKQKPPCQCGHPCFESFLINLLSILPLFIYSVFFFSFSPLAVFKISFSSLLLNNSILIWRYNFFMFPVNGIHWALGSVGLKFQQLWKLFSHYLFKYFSMPHSLSPETPKTVILGCLKLSQSSLMHFSFMSFCLSMVHFRYILLLCLQYTNLFLSCNVLSVVYSIHHI